MLTFGQWLRAHQSRLGLRDEDLIARVQIVSPGLTGISAPSLSRWRNERASCLPSLGQFVVLCRAMDLPPSEVFFGLELGLRRDLDRRREAPEALVLA